MADNYRPVSLTCICSKLLEHILSSQIMAHLEGHNILYQHQHGFRAGRSCETQLLEFTRDLHAKANCGIQTDSVVLYFSKAFDKVAHNKLAYKLYWYGTRGPTRTWIGHFLANRSQQVGSVLGLGAGATLSSKGKTQYLRCWHV